MEFEMKRDSLTIQSIEKRILQLKVSIKHTKKTTRIHQNNKKMIRLNEELNRAVYHHNKFDLFKVLEKELDKELHRLLDMQFASL